MSKMSGVEAASIGVFAAFMITGSVAIANRDNRLPLTSDTSRTQGKAVRVNADVRLRHDLSAITVEGLVYPASRFYFVEIVPPRLHDDHSVDVTRGIGELGHYQVTHFFRQPNVTFGGVMIVPVDRYGTRPVNVQIAQGDEVYWTGVIQYVPPTINKRRTVR